MASAAPLWFDNGTFIDPNINDLSHHVELEDLDGDGDVDIIFVNNTAEYAGNPGSAQLNRVYLNDGGIFTDDGGSTFQIPDNARVVKTGDVNGDGNVDIVAGACWSGDSYILFGSGGGTFIEGGSLPTGITVGDFDLGDFDNDGDLDIVASDYGSLSDLGAVDDVGAVLQLWENDGSGNFSNTNMFAGTYHVAYSKKVSFVDVDNDFDFDVVAASHGGGTDIMDFDAFPQNRVFINDNNVFTELPQDAFSQLRVCTNITMVDFNDDLYLDMFTLQDGGGFGDPARRDRVILNDPNNGGTFTTSPDWLTAMNSTQALHRIGQLIDFNHDRRPDLVVAGLDNPNDNFTLLRHDGAELVIDEPPFDVPGLNHISSSAIADLDGDYIDDIVLAQHNSFNNNYVLNGTDDLGADAGAPVIGVWEQLGSAMVGETVHIRARIHDNKNPTKPHDWLLENGERVMPYVEYVLNLPDEPTVEEFNTLSDNSETTRIATVWTGEYMHRGS
ncbi:MAG: FG-GAP repeat domain-containing protein, partial [Nannocystaceae bacterium]